MEIDFGPSAWPAGPGSDEEEGPLGQSSRPPAEPEPAKPEVAAPGGAAAAAAAAAAPAGPAHAGGEPRGAGDAGAAPTAPGRPGPSDSARHEQHQEQEQGPPPPPAPSGPAVPSHLARLLASAARAPAAPSGAQLLLLAAHAAMLETGFAPCGPAAALAANSLSGAVADSGVSAGAAAAAGDADTSVELLIGSGVGGVYTIRYDLPQPDASGGVEDGGADAGGAEGAAPPAVRLVLRCVEVGPHLVVAGAVTGGAAPAPAPAALQSLPLSVSRFTRAPPPAAANADAPPGAALAARLLDVPSLWRDLRDRVALPLLASARAAAGLPPPAGLLSLPWELQEAWLARLPARDLARLCACCAQLRNLGSLDCLWQPLFESEFPHASPAERADGNARGWRAAFSSAWARRESRRRAAARLVRPFPHAAPFPPGPAPWAPPRPPGGAVFPPNTIGGDYDRLPGGLGFGGGLGGGGGFIQPQGFGGLGGGGLGGGPPFMPGFGGAGRRGGGDGGGGGGGGGGGRWRLY